jgi:glycosyltransferase 2 family protein
MLARRVSITADRPAPPAAPARVNLARRWQRHPADAARLVVSLLVVGVLTLVGIRYNDEIRDSSADLITLVDNLPSGIVSFLVGIVQFMALVAPVVVLGTLLWRRQLRLVGLLVLAAVLAGVTMSLLSGLLGDTVPTEAVARQRTDSWFTGAAFPSSSYLAAFAAMVVAASTFMTRTWRRWAWVAIVVVAFVRLLTAIEIPLHLSLVVAIGAFAGSVAVLITGAPPRRIDPDTLRVTLAGAGVVVTDLEPVSEVRGLVTFRATGPDVPPSFVRVLGREERDGDLLLRSLRSLRVKGMGDDRPSGSPRRVAEHAVLAQALTARAGVRLPAPTAVALTGEGAALIVEDWVDGARLDELGATDIGDALLHNLWREVAVMQRRRIAHRALNASNIRVTGDDAVLVDFRQADLSAPDHVLGADVAELLTSIATIVGAERVVTVAAAELGPEALARALPLLQPVVLTPRTRAAAKAQRGLLDDLRSHTQVAAGVEEFELAQIHRITLKGIVSLVGSLVLAAYLFNLVADWSEIWAALQTADLTAVPWLVVFYVMGTVGGALSMMGSVTQPLPLWQTSEIMIAQSFLNRFTPANAGGMALRARYLQLSGVDLTVAAAAVGLTSVASGVAQFLLIVVFFVWGGQTDAFSEISLPSVGSILLLAVAVGALGGAIALTGWGKRTVVPWVKRTWNKAFGSFRQLGSRPDLLGKLFGGTFLGKFANLFSFYVCVLAFGVDMPFSQAGAVYMVGNTIGSAVPTPGGVGGVEAALTAALLSVNVDPATAAAIVLLFRLFTFWLPTIPGWFFLQRVQRQGIV